MADQAATLWVQENLNKLAMTRAAQAIQATGRALPCTVTAIVDGGFVTVKFEATFTSYSSDLKTSQPNTLPPITIPKAESQWLRAPTQVGDVGLTVPADTFLGAISGQGTGVADLGVEYGNLSTLVWIPVAAKSFGVTPNANAPWLNGPDGAIVSDTAQTVLTIYDPTGKAISHIVPATGGKIGLGALASTLSSARAATANADLTTLSNNLISQTMQTLATAIGAAASTAAIPNAAAFAAILGGSGWVSGLSGINPTIPPGSSIVRVVS